jgi:hypothetical protein
MEIGRTPHLRIGSPFVIATPDDTVFVDARLSGTFRKFKSFIGCTERVIRSAPVVPEIIEDFVDQERAVKIIDRNLPAGGNGMFSSCTSCCEGREDE